MTNSIFTCLSSAAPIKLFWGFGMCAYLGRLIRRGVKSSGRLREVPTIVISVTWKRFVFWKTGRLGEVVA